MPTDCGHDHDCDQPDECACGRPVRTRTATRCRQCACRHTYHQTHTKGTAMTTTNPTLGDIGEEQTEVELEPLEIPQPAPAEQPVPA